MSVLVGLETSVLISHWIWFQEGSSCLGTPFSSTWMRFQGLWTNVPEGYDQLPDYVTFMQKQEWESLNPSIVLVHIGTNDLQPGITVAGLIDKYEVLVALLKRFFPSCTIFCSAMLPRPRDYPLTRFILKSCNDALGIVANQKGCIYVQTFKPFMAEGRPRAYLFSDITSCTLIA